MSTSSSLLLEDQIELRTLDRELIEAEDDLALAKTCLAATDAKSKDYNTIDAEVRALKTKVDNIRRDLRAHITASKQRYIDYLKNPPKDPLVGTTVKSTAGSSKDVNTQPTAPKDMKIKDPSTFNGATSDYSRFVFEIQNVLRVRNRIDTDVKKITYVGSLLTDAGLTWYKLWIESHTTNNIITAPYASFCIDLATTFKDPLEVSNYRRELALLKQEGMEFNEYSIKFRNTCMKADLVLDSQVETFKNSLHRTTLVNWHPTTMPTTYDATVESIRTSVQIYKSIQSLSPMAHGKSPSKPPFQKSSNPSTRQPSTSDPTKVGIYVNNPETPTYKQRMKDGVCTRCGMANHKAKDCPNYPPSVPGAVNYQKSKQLFPDRYNNMDDGASTYKYGGGSQRGGRRRQPGREEFNAKETKDVKDKDSEDGSDNTSDSDLYTGFLGSLRHASPLFLIDFVIPRLGRQPVKGKAMVDSGANRTLISHEIVKRYELDTTPLRRPLNLTLGDGKTRVTLTQQTTKINLVVGTIADEVELLVLNTKGYDIVLGLDWLIRNNPRIDWKAQTIEPTVNLESPPPQTIPTPLDKPQLFIHSTTPLITDLETQQLPPSSWPMSEFPKIFDPIQQQQLPPHRPGWDFDVEFKDQGALPKNRHMFRLPRHQRQLVEEYVKNDLKSGKLRVTNSSVTSNLFFVPKADSTTEMRPCVDYRGLNECTKSDNYPLPPLSELVQQLVGGDWYAKLDWRWAYNNIRIKEGSEWKFAIKCHLGSYEPLVMPFGPKQAPGHMQRFVTEHCKDLVEEGWLFNLLDDFVIKTVGSIDEHKTHIRRYLQRIQELNINVKESKCLFFEKEIPFVGFMVNKFGYWKQPQKVDAIAKWGTPRSVKDIRSFLGYVNFYRPFVSHLSVLAKPLYDLTAKGVQFKWGEPHQLAFDQIKATLTKDVFLMFPRPEKPYIIHFDASEVGMGAVLQQYDEEGNLRPIEFYSRKWNPAEYNYATPDKELYSLVSSLRHWYPILFGAKKIQAYTDHKSLRNFSKTQLLKPRHARWALVLEDFKDVMTIHWISGKKNVLADVASRDPSFNLDEQEMKERLAVVILPKSLFMDTTPGKGSDDIRLETDSGGKSTFPPQGSTKMLIDPTDSILDTHNNIDEIDDSDNESNEEEEDDSPNPRQCQPHQTDITNDQERKKEVLHLYHDHVLAGHLGFRKTLELIRRRYWWKGMVKEVKSYCQSCDTCQKAKVSRHSPTGKLLPLPIPDRNWQYLTMDFIVKLPKSNKMDSILVVVDRRSKQSHFIPTTEAITAEKTAKLVFNHIVCKHGLPQSIVSDRGPQFKSKFWKELWRLLGCKVNLSTAYHPETDGQSERVNQTLEQYLRCFTSYNQDDWTDLLPMAELAYNNSYHDSIGMSPLFAVTGQNAEIEPVEHASATPVTNPPEAGRIKSHIDNIYNQLQKHLSKAQRRYKEAADSHRSEEPLYSVNEQVLVSTKNIRTERPTKKLDWVYVGPYRIKRQINAVTYEVDLPQTSHIHPVFHVKLLKKYIPGEDPDRHIIPPPPIQSKDKEVGYEIEAIKDVRPKGNGHEYLIGWKGYGPEDDTWETRTTLQDDEMLRRWHEDHPDKISPFVRKHRRGNNVTNVTVEST